jgi:uncharacterized membrane protein YphA (DoxX/SURF4 family)
MDYKDEMMQVETHSLFAILALLACILVIRAGFKKSQAHGIAGIGAVSLALYLYFTVPAAATIITILFSAFLLIGLVGVVKEIL